MPKNIKPGDVINGYTISDLLNKGAMATAYAARNAAGRKVFLKQYKSPTVTVPWYKAYVKYQAELKRRIETTRAKEYCYEIIDFFEATWGTPCYFQVFEFVEKGYDLEKNLQQIRTNPKSVSWEQRVLLAKVFLAGLSAIHEARIVHSDLKPPNIQLFKDDSIAAKYRLKLIDMDYSVLSDVRAPWHGVQGYVGTDGYFSPEHLNGKPPVEASDVFTASLILCELLTTGGHPYRLDTMEQYQAAVLAHKATPPKFVGVMPPPADTAAVAGCLHLALSPDPAKRPTARELLLTFNGRLASASVPAKPASAPPAAPPPPKGARLELASAGGQKLTVGITSDVGRDFCAALGEDARFLGSRQFVLNKVAGGWEIIPDPDTANETLLNGKAQTERRTLRDGDVIAVGRESKGIAKLPLTVKLL